MITTRAITNERSDGNRAAPPRPSPRDDRPCALVVDADAWVRDRVEALLVEEGYIVYTAENGAVALDLLERVARAGEPSPDVILLEMRLPVMDGRTFAAEYRARRLFAAPIIVITAVDAAQNAAAIGADGALAKPFDLDEMLAV